MEGLNQEGIGIVRMRAPRLSCQQFDVLMNFMRAHPHFAAGRAGGSVGLTTREEHELWWHQLTEELNAAVGPNKSTPKWQKCWIDLKSNARSRVSKIRAAMSNPGLEAVTPTLTQWDHQVLSLMGPAFADIVELFKNQKRDYGARGDTAENNSNSSFHDQEQVYQHLESSPQASPYELQQNGHHTTSSDSALSGVKAEEDEEEIIFEEVECDVTDAGYSEEIDQEPYNPILNGVAARLSSAISPSVTVSPVTVPVSRHGNISLVSSSTTQQQQRHIPVYSEVPTSRKRKSPEEEQHGDDSYEKVPKGTLEVLERIASAAEESNDIQRQLIIALNRISDSFAQVVPLVKHLTANSTAPKRRS